MVENIVAPFSGHYVDMFSLFFLTFQTQFSTF